MSYSQYGSAFNWAPITPSSDDLSPVPRALWVGTAGTANLTTNAGVDTDDVPLLQGYNPFSPKKVRAGGTASDIWAIY